MSIAGPSGSGKTTLLNLIGCIDRADAGEITIDGSLVSGMGRDELALFRRKNLGFVFQTFNLIPVLTAYENVAFALSLLGVSERETRERTMAILAEVGLAGHGGSPALAPVRRPAAARGRGPGAGEGARPSSSPTSPRRTSTPTPARPSSS